jgi:hypothetical protein
MSCVKSVHDVTSNLALAILIVMLVRMTSIKVQKL